MNSSRRSAALIDRAQEAMGVTEAGGWDRTHGPNLANPGLRGPVPGVSVRPGPAADGRPGDAGLVSLVGRCGAWAPPHTWPSRRRRRSSSRRRPASGRLPTSGPWARPPWARSGGRAPLASAALGFGAVVGRLRRGRLRRAPAWTRARRRWVADAVARARRFGAPGVAGGRLRCDGGGLRLRGGRSGLRGRRGFGAVFRLSGRRASPFSRQHGFAAVILGLRSRKPASRRPAWPPCPPSASTRGLRSGLGFDAVPGFGFRERSAGVARVRAVRVAVGAGVPVLVPPARGAGAGVSTGVSGASS